jgi:hypothetical protein
MLKAPARTALHCFFYLESFTCDGEALLQLAIQSEHKPLPMDECGPHLKKSPPELDHYKASMVNSGINYAY